MAKINQAMQDLLRYNAAMLPRKRSSFDKSHSHTTTLDSAWLVPVMWDRVLPGDEKKIRYSGLARMATPIHPVMDEANLDVWCFFVPDRLTWAHAKEFYGENLDASFNPDGEFVMPGIAYKDYVVMSQWNASYAPDSASGQHYLHSLCDYFGMPLSSVGQTSNNTAASGSENRVNALLFRGYQLIWNDWFRNSSIQQSLQLNTGDTVTSSELLNTLLKIRKVCKYPDYFTSLLREPQAGADVLLPLGEWAPVVTRNEPAATGPQEALGFTNANTGLTSFTSGVLGVGQTGQAVVGGSYPSSGQPAYPYNLWADLTNATSATINNIRAAVTIQHLLEVDALAGKRYQQILQAHFGVFTPDATLQRPELLGACRTPVGMRQVLQTSATASTGTPQGNVAAFSLTNVNNEWICNKAFTEPGFIYVLAAIRPTHSYSQGIDCLLTKLNRYDHYWPVFDNLGNQPVYLQELYASQTNSGSSAIQIDYAGMRQVFGYKEAWAEYKIKQNRVSGLMRPDAAGTLSSWNYADIFTGTSQLLNSDFVSETETLIDRTIAVKTEPQFILDNYFDYIDIKNMSVHSIPGVTTL